MERKAAHSGDVKYSGVLGRKLKDWGTQIFLLLPADDEDFERERGIFMYTTATRCQVHFLFRKYVILKPPHSPVEEGPLLTPFTGVAAKAREATRPRAQGQSLPAQEADPGHSKFQVLFFCLY